MRLLLADPDTARRHRTARRLAALPGITLSDLCSDLTATFNAVEHRPPTLVILAEELIRRPEFEMMEMLFRTLSVRWMPLAARMGPGGGPGWGSRGGLPSDTAEALDPDLDDAALLAALRRQMIVGSPATPRAGAGLLRLVDPASADRVILIGSSTGGVDALLRVLDAFPLDCPPTLIVQHTGAAYSAGLARLLNRHVTPEVREAINGEPPRRGVVMLAPGSEHHLVLDTVPSLRCRLEPGARIAGHRPSVDMLFRSAVPVARRVTAALLTGMGRDGGEGLLALRLAGAQTIGQDRATSVVYGMPGYAAELGAVSSVLPLSAIGPAILRVAQGIKV